MSELSSNDKRFVVVVVFFFFFFFALSSLFISFASPFIVRIFNHKFSDPVAQLDHSCSIYQSASRFNIKKDIKDENKFVFEINEDIVKVSPMYQIELTTTRKDKKKGIRDENKLVFEIDKDIVKVSPEYQIELATTRKDKVPQNEIISLPTGY
ncbi:hypothetical protein SDJN03_07578, partial [Cucurbita argyrosperma subsp. sororia]